MKMDKLRELFGKIREKLEGSPYCKHCGGCGYIGCDGIEVFLGKHVEGKTNCSSEAGFIADIISYIEMAEEDE